MEVLAVCIGRTKTVEAHDAKGNVRKVRTGIYKAPVDGPVFAGKLGLEGDKQADTRVFKGRQVHGGRDKAVYLYPAEHYAAWERELGRQLPFGQFGENLAVSGLNEETVRVGDRLRVGGALFEVTTPRGPCYKLDIRMEHPEFRHLMNANGRTGFYVRVIEEGPVCVGDRIEIVQSDGTAPTVLEYHRANL